ncbi:toll/interleukin-1 receptor domain-containing protein [Mesorhizobium erdmanii]|nr:MULTISPECIES: toll/interleukin-1 receptor domain-containing protein [Mesorhizobium]
MKIFASWSGQQSRQVAEAIREWLPNVLQSSKVFMSKEDIAVGDRGLNAIAESLKECEFGVIVLTATNLTAPWILFEAGALSNRFPTARVAPILCGLRDLATAAGPLGQFQHVRFDREGIEKLVHSVNSASENRLEDKRVQEAFDMWWPRLEAKYLQIPPDQGSTAEATEADHRADVEAALSLIINEMQGQRAMLDRATETIARIAGGVIPYQWIQHPLNQFGLMPTEPLTKGRIDFNNPPELNPAAPDT